MRTNESLWQSEDIVDTRKLQIHALKEMMKGLGYVFRPSTINSQAYFYSADYSNKGRSRISVKSAIGLYNGNSVKCVFGRPPQFLTIWSFDDFSVAKAKAARILKSLKIQYCWQTKQIIVQDHRVQFTIESYSRLFLNNKYL